LYPKATDHIREMIAIVERLVERKLAYLADDGSVYFAIDKFKGYGKLSRLDTREVRSGARVIQDDYSKENAQDFALWKAAKPEDEATGAAWDSPWGRGRPGWHLECSAMALRLLGESPIDIHAGGIDLIFPHHENEIAQSEGATGKLFSRFWMHVEYLIVEEKKMSKSLGNTYTIPDVVSKNFRPSAVRYLLLSAHYRKQLNFTWESLAGAEKALQRLTDCLGRLDAVTADGSRPELAARVATAERAFSEAMQADLNTAAALGAIFELVSDLNSAIDAGVIGKGDVAVAKAAFDRFDRVLGVVSLRQAEDAKPPVPVDEIDRLIEDRHAARRRRDFTAADRIRQDLAARGVLLEDNAAGTRWKRK
jgi:cysteinyl-tRNA synthetase